MVGEPAPTDKISRYKGRVSADNIQIGQIVDRTLTHPTQQSDLIRVALTRHDIGQHSQRVKNLSPGPRIGVGGQYPKGQGRMEKAEGKKANIFT